MQLVKHLAMMSRNGPLEQELSGLDDASTAALAQIKESAEPENVDAALKAMRKAQTEAESGSSLMAVQKFVSVQSIANGREYEKHVVTWAIEWELAVTERIDRDLAIVRKLQGDRDHYEGKVAGLRRKSNELEAKGKTSPRNQVAKLERNEEKLKDAFVRHESEAGRLCALIESVVHDGWIELYQLCRNYMKWESNRGECTIISFLLFLAGLICTHLTSFLTPTRTVCSGTRIRHLPRACWRTGFYESHLQAECTKTREYYGYCCCCCAHKRQTEEGSVGEACYQVRGRQEKGGTQENREQLGVCSRILIPARRSIYFEKTAACFIVTTRRPHDTCMERVQRIYIQIQSLL